LVRLLAGEQLPGVATRGVGEPLAAQHAGDFFHPGGARQHGDPGPSPTSAHGLGHQEMMTSAGGDRRQMGDAEYLATAGRHRELVGHRSGDAGAHTCVHLVEDHRGDALVVREYDFDGQHRP